MNANEETLKRFYTAFQERDAAGMAACYAPDVQFSDPVFTDLRGADAGAMWKMLCERGRDLRLEFRDVRADANTGSAHWEAWYTFSATGRKVHNIIDATFEFRNGAIVKHTDRFDLYRWSRQALGPAGVLLGWTPLLRNKVRAMAAKGLADYQRNSRPTEASQRS
jgi:ketosteroid isomerase-like protein